LGGCTYVEGGEKRPLVLLTGGGRGKMRREQVRIKESKQNLAPKKPNEKKKGDFRHKIQGDYPLSV